MNTRLWTVAIWASVSGACVLPLPQDGGELMDSGTGAGSSTGSSGGSSGLADADGTTGADSGSTSMNETGTTGGEESTDGGETTEGEGPASVCDPQPEAIAHVLYLDPDREIAGGEVIEVDTTCTVTAIASAAGIYSISLACDDGDHELDVLDLGPIDLMVGQVVTLRAHDCVPWWRQTFVVLSREDTMIIAGMSAEGLPGKAHQYNPDAAFFDPLAIEIVPDVCRPEPSPDEDCGAFICPEGCTQDERQVLRFTNSDGSTDVYDHGTGSLGNLQIGVGTAELHVQVFCTDTASAMYRFVTMRTT